jgi:hypothetical protein
MTKRSSKRATGSSTPCLPQLRKSVPEALSPSASPRLSLGTQLHQRPQLPRTFSDAFNKESFNSLPECRTWDHAIELILDSKLANCKVYLISLLKQKELNAFIAEGLNTGRIHLSKSPMVSLVFFIKKKDRALWFIQDYQVLNTMTVKSQYLLPLINNHINGLKAAHSIGIQQCPDL